MAKKNHIKIVKSGSWPLFEWRLLHPKVQFDLSYADLQNIDLPNALLAGSNLCGANLANANLERADLRGVDLSDADLSLTNLYGATCDHWTRLDKAKLFNANLERADLKDAYMDCANLEKAFLRYSDLRGAWLANSNLKDANLYHAHLGLNVRTGALTNLSDVDLRNADLGNAELNITLMSNADLTNADLRGARIIGCDVNGVNMNKVSFGLTVLAELNLSKVKNIEKVRHVTSSMIGIETIMETIRNLEESNLASFLNFLQKIGLSSQIVENFGKLKPIDIQSVFISYCKADEGFAYKLSQDLRKAGAPTFLFSQDAQGGRRVENIIGEQIALKDRVLVVCSKTSLTKNGILNEIDRAIQKEQNENRQDVIFPIIIDDVLESSNSPYVDMLRGRVWRDFRYWQDKNKYKSELNRLVNDLHSRINKPAFSEYVALPSEPGRGAGIQKVLIVNYKGPVPPEIWSMNSAEEIKEKDSKWMFMNHELVSLVPNSISNSFRKQLHKD